MGNQPGSGAIMRETLQSLATVRGVRAGWRQALLAAVARNPRPTLVVWGDQDRVLPASHLECLVRRVDDATVALAVADPDPRILALGAVEDLAWSTHQNR